MAVLRTPRSRIRQLMWYNADMLDAAGIDVTGTEGWTYGDDGTGLPNWQKLTTDENGDGNPEVYGFSTIGFYDYFYRIPARSNGELGDAPIKVSLMMVLHSQAISIQMKQLKHINLCKIWSTNTTLLHQKSFQTKCFQA